VLQGGELVRGRARGQPFEVAPAVLAEPVGEAAQQGRHVDRVAGVPRRSGGGRRGQGGGLLAGGGGLGRGRRGGRRAAAAGLDRGDGGADLVRPRPRAR